MVPRRPPATFWEHCKDALGDEMLQVLVVAGVISLIIGVLTEHAETGWIEGFAILLAGTLCVQPPHVPVPVCTCVLKTVFSFVNVCVFRYWFDFVLVLVSLQW